MEKQELLKIFGKIEIETIIKKIKGKKLKQTERNYLSKSIRPKLRIINHIARLQLLKDINKRTKRALNQEIIYNLTKYGYELISLNKIQKDKKIPIEELIIKIIIDHPEARYIEAIPIILLKNKINRFKLLELATKFNTKNELGYLIETALMIKEKKELKELLTYLKHSKDKDKRILGEDLGKEYKEFITKNTPARLKSWNLLGRFFDQDFKLKARGYL
jgi:hypothetical protein